MFCSRRQYRAARAARRGRDRRRSQSNRADPGPLPRRAWRNVTCAPTATRTRDLLLRRHSRNAAESRLISPDVLFVCSKNRWLRPGIAWWLWSLAPRLAPQNLISDMTFEAQDRRGGELPVDCLLRPRVRCAALPPSRPAHAAQRFCSGGRFRWGTMRSDPDSREGRRQEVVG